MKIRALLTLIVFSLAGAAFAQQKGVRKTSRSEQKFTIEAGGTFVLDNPVGNIEILGADVADVEASIATSILAADDAGLQEARRQSGILIEGTPKTRVIRTAVAANHQQKPWSVTVHWTVRVPRTVNVSVVSSNSNRIRVADLQGNVRVQNFHGNIMITNVEGSAFIEVVNGSIVYHTANKPRANIVLSTVNGDVQATVGGNSDLRWIAKTIAGDIRTNLPVRGAFIAATFRGSVNAPGGPTITTSALMGNIHLLAAGPAATTTVSLRDLKDVIETPTQPQLVSKKGNKVERIVSNITYETSIGDVKVTEVRGDADILTGAGQVQLGSVNGTARVRSLGGPLYLGEMLGTLTASTRAGDILVDSTRRGGTIATEGGTISLLYTSGPTRLTSGGGDITVKQAAAPIIAETKSGDISITIDSGSRSESVDAATGKGNVIVNVPAKFRADIEATILTSDPNADTIVCDLPGLSITREQVGSMTRIHATGKINGGGKKLNLQATGGDIRISTGRVGPTVVRPR
jgi:DUF4097 and DUF4098 domain-containing protein YvlB